MPSLREATGVAAPLLKANITTDTIAPFYRPATVGTPRALTTTTADLAKNLFAAWRFDADDNEIADFVLNRAPFRAAKFILAGANFACGSSRETAVTMLHAFGIRCVIAPSFGQIFYDNCFRNGMLPLIQPWESVAALAVQAETGAPFALDVAAGRLQAPDGTVIAFTLPSFRRDALLTGADEVTVTLQHEGAIAAWQEAARQQRPWAHPAAAAK